MKHYKPRNCLLCGKQFIPTNPNNYYCSPQHQIIRSKALLAQKRAKEIEARKRKCSFCHKPFVPKLWSHETCSKECTTKRRGILRRIFNLWGDPAEAMKQREKFEKLGKDYRFPEPFEMFNDWYGLT